MTVQIIIQVLLFGIALSMDAFAVAVADGLVYRDINKKRSIFIAFMFGLMQAVMPLIGYWLVEIVTIIVDKESGETAGEVMSVIVTWLAFALLVYIGLKMLIEAIINLKKKEEKKIKTFSIKEVFFFSVATAIDALATGVAFHAGISSNLTIWLHASIIMLITFNLSLIGVVLASKIQKLFKGRYEITSLIGGSILIVLAIWIVLSHYFGF